MQSYNSPKKVVGRLLVAALLVGAGILGAVRDNATVTEIPWGGDLRAATARSQRQGRPLLLSFADPRSLWSDKMVEETFTDSRVVRLAENCECVRLQKGSDAALASRYHVIAYPTTILLSPQGRALARCTGYVDSGAFLAQFAGPAHD